MCKNLASVYNKGDPSRRGFCSFSSERLCSNILEEAWFKNKWTLTSRKSGTVSILEVLVSQLYQGDLRSWHWLLVSNVCSFYLDIRCQTQVTLGLLSSVCVPPVSGGTWMYKDAWMEHKSKVQHFMKQIFKYSHILLLIYFLVQQRRDVGIKKTLHLCASKDEQLATGSLSKF